MLVRAARRKARPDTLRSRVLSEQLSLPWLCPANTICQTSRRWVSIEAGSYNPGVRKRRDSNDTSKQTARRAMATAAGYTAMDEIPFVGMGTVPPRLSPNPNMMNGSSLYELHHGHEPISLGGSVATTPSLRLKLEMASGVSGDIAEVHAVFDACLQVGRIERAGAILRRMSKMDLPLGEIVYLHLRYLRAAVAQIMDNPTEAAMQGLHKWFELEIRSKDIPQGVEMVAYMVKAALQSPKGKKERLVRRYMGMLDREASLELLQYAEVLTAHELNLITQIYPNYNYETRADEEYEDLDEFPLEALEQNHTASEKVIPEVKAMEQKGMGLKSLKSSLSLFSTLPSEGIDIANASPKMRREIQARLESDAVESAITRWREESAHLTKMGMNTSLQTKSLGGRMWKWQLALEEHLKQELVKLEEAEIPSARKSVDENERLMYGPFLRTIAPQKLAAVTILSTMSSLGSLGADKGLPLAAAIMAIAKSVEDESTYEDLRRSRRSNIWPTSKNTKNIFSREAILKATRGRGAGAVSKYANHFLDKPDMPSKLQDEWPVTVRAKVGAFLMSALIEIAQVPVTLTHPKTLQEVTQMQPAFSHSLQYKMGKKLGIILANKTLVAQMRREPVHSLLAKHLPMLVEPEPWTLFNKGGFISHPGKIMRIKSGDKDQRFYAEAAIDQGDMKIMFDGLNALGRTPWRINQPVFDVMLEAWNTGEAIANIPSEDPKLSIPPEPEPSTDPLERRRWIRAVKNVENSRSGLHSQRCFQNFQMEIARALRNEQFYFPHNIDFRGRAYPIPPYLNHMGADHCRGLLMFGKGRELGETGLKWIKIHLANVFGYDKASLSEREEFSMKNLDSVIDSATKPLTGARWWLEAEDPWQCLAACIELNNALNAPDPTRFVSHLPVHQDGTCNGLQHYAALGGDVWGARQVNLEPGDRPADVYTAVADIVKAQIAEGKEKGDPLAAFLDGKISRKTVKQTVMTNVYGVTFVGAKAQVRKQLVAAYPNIPDDDKINPGILASYVATRIFTALSTMFKGAHDIQHWLGECASRISTCLTREQITRLEAEWDTLVASKNIRPVYQGKYTPKVTDLVQFKSSVIWTNPVHMPVVQPYRNSKAKTVTTSMQRLSLSEPHRSDPVSKRKQLQGFPPNFIHSLDATHMILSALRCDELGLSFAAVHDSFWTHASDVGTMNRVLRDSFIQIHSDDVMGRLGTEFTARYKNCVYLRKLPATSPAYKKILDWRASRAAERRNSPCISLHLDELRLEARRQKLLGSSDPAEVEKGKEMVTAASILEDVDTSGKDRLDTSLELPGLGDVSFATRLAVEESIEHESIGSGEEDPGLHHTESTSSDKSSAGYMEQEAEHSSPEDEPTSFEKRITPRTDKRKWPSQMTSTMIWLPLTFPPVPEKGEFDVSRLKNSEYFFS